MCYVHTHQTCNSSLLPEPGHNCGTFLRNEIHGSNAVCFRRVVGLDFNAIFGRNWPSIIWDFSWPWSPSFPWPMWSYTTPFGPWSLTSSNQPLEWRLPCRRGSLSGQPQSHVRRRGPGRAVADSLQRGIRGGALEPTRWYGMVILYDRTRPLREKCWKMV